MLRMPIPVSRRQYEWLLKTRILRYRKKMVREAGGYIGDRCAKAWHSSVLHVTTRAVCAGAPQATRHVRGVPGRRTSTAGVPARFR
jgi:hypothetical protein